MKYISLIFSVFCLINICYSQEILSSGGGFDYNINGSISYTIGEPITETLISNNKILTQGFQQSRISITAIENIEFENIDISIYPNPTDSYIYISIESDTYYKFAYILIDINGKIILQEQFNNNFKDINIKSLPQGAYILKIEFDKSLFKTYKIIKK
ncbi:MAG: T9SS type A sorting domain-containing protein [Bacteroidales bacterium]|jgi:hypothetical protein|nr:T9SS type A sorting domain-containing protein [Bacteroidales bacterium]